nr:hypothetical protein [Variovorax boronicumulans]
MTLALLRKIEAATLPLQLSQRADIDETQILRAADLVAAMFLRPPESGASPHRVARVLAITARGRALLAAERAPHSDGTP